MVAIINSMLIAWHTPLWWWPAIIAGATWMVALITSWYEIVEAAMGFAITIVLLGWVPLLVWADGDVTIVSLSLSMVSVPLIEMYEDKKD